MLYATSAWAVVPWSIQINTNNVVYITNALYGAIGDGMTTNTAAIQAAIDAAMTGGTTNGLTGGTVEIPAPGTYLCGPLNLSNNVNFQIDSGAVLRMLSYTQYPGGIVNPPNFISGKNLTNIEVSGSGAIDGQGAPWWPGYKTNNRPIMIYFDSCKNQLIQNVTLSNSPEFHIAQGGSPANTTVQGITVQAPDSVIGNPASHNTDACDVNGTNVLVQNCNISTGDDDFACGGGTHDVLVTNNTYGYGHGVSIGSYTDGGGVSNLVVINCTFNGTQNGIRIKSDNDRGGLVQNINYFNLSMTNVEFPIQVYAYYNEVGTPSSVSPYYAATQQVAAVTVTNPIYRNITFSNITASAIAGYPAALIWSRTELPGTNIVFKNVNISASRPFEIYNTRQVTLLNCTVTQTLNSNVLSLFNAQVTVSNSVPLTNLMTLDGITTNGYGNALSFYDSVESLFNTNCLGSGPIALGASTLTVSNNLTLYPGTVLNFTLGTNAATMPVVGNLTQGGTINIFAGPGFTNGTNALLTCSGTLTGSLPTLGTTPSGYVCALNNTSGHINLVVTTPAPPAPTNLMASATNLAINLTWNSVLSANSYNLKRGTINGVYPTIYSSLAATNYTDANVTNTVTYYYVVSAVGNGGESTNSPPVSAAPLPSNVPTNLLTQVVGNLLQLSWPQDHIGWRLQMQTNSLSAGLGTNWTDVPGATYTNQVSITINPTNGVVFFHLVYP